MANFGFSRLAVVAPYAPHWREARSAVGAPEPLQHATEVATLAESVAASTLVLGTGTLTYRKPEQPVVTLPELPSLVARELAQCGHVTLVFGPEKHGLTREDLSYCHLLVEIPTDSRQPSMNLGQAVAVCVYELAVRTAVPEEMRNPETAGPAESGHRGTISDRLEILAGVVEEVLAAAHYSPRLFNNRLGLRLLLRRLDLSDTDATHILGMFRRILWRLNRGEKDETRRD
jgi:tRNA/rRNA methyltransferase